MDIIVSEGLPEDICKSSRLTIDFSLEESINKFSLFEEDIDQLENGFLKVNVFYYFCSFKEVDKYEENRYTFQRFHIEDFLEDIKDRSFKSMEDYIKDFKLEVIEDSTYEIKRLSFL